MTMGRSLRADRRAALALIAAVSAALGVNVSAHRRDEFLQAARIGIAPDRVHLEMNLTAGIAVADGVIAGIDGDGDGLLSPIEKHGYAQHVASRVTLRVDDLPPLRLSVADASFPTAAAMRAGEAAIRLSLEAAMPPLGIGAHRVRFSNNNATKDSVYLANALVPDDDQVAVTGQARDFDQRELIIEFAVREPPRSIRLSLWIGLASALALAAATRRSASVRSRR
jgi:hypothetical protein